MAKTYKSKLSNELLSIRFLPTIFVFVVIMAISAVNWQTARTAITTSRDEQVDIRSQFVESDIRQRINLYTNALRSAAGFIESSEHITSEEWRHFARSLNITIQLPATVSLGYSEIIPGGSDDTPAARIVFAEPTEDEGGGIVGRQLPTAGNLSMALETARDRAQASMTSSNSFRAETSDESDIVIFYPVYHAGEHTTTAARRANIIGYTFISMQTDQLFKNLLRDTGDSLSFRIYEGEEKNNASLLHERLASDVANGFSTAQTSVITLNDQIWTIVYSANDEIVANSIRQRPTLTLLSGFLFAAVVSALVYTLMQRRTRQIAEQETKRIENAKDSLLSLASHQLRTPATGVKQYLGMVLEGFSGDLNSDQKDLLGRAYDSNERQLHIINEFLYLARADAGRVIISPQIFNIGELVRQIVSDMQSNVLEAGHTLKIKQRAKLINVYADPHSARMIIENLISNAVKYTPAGGKITITLTKQLGDVVVKVEDNGVGIDRKDFKKLFKQFSRIPNELSKQTSGSGIGLYLAKYLARSNKGNISLRSKPHIGSTFILTLPGKPPKKA